MMYACIYFMNLGSCWQRSEVFNLMIWMIPSTNFYIFYSIKGPKKWYSLFPEYGKKTVLIQELGAEIFSFSYLRLDLKFTKANNLKVNWQQQNKRMKKSINLIRKKRKSENNMSISFNLETIWLLLPVFESLSFIQHGQ